MKEELRMEWKQALKDLEVAEKNKGDKEVLYCYLFCVNKA